MHVAADRLRGDARARDLVAVEVRGRLRRERAGDLRGAVAVGLAGEAPRRRSRR
ncbi:hypothetical protein [Clavibacter tessellarius]|uniref:hypothetical protein n=1 Tax=Clavibacter tessellarius TaxID=31965 RepID=UPI0032537DF9